jgi:sugar phosphate isomerase/epimerase
MTRLQDQIPYVETSMLLSMTTDFRSSTDDPLPHLRAIAEAGFTHAHWCHQWNTDYLYGADEVRAIARALRDHGPLLLDLHASEGKATRCWTHDVAVRRAGIDLVVNRIRMTAELGGRAIVLHPPAPQVSREDAVRTLDALVSHAEPLGIRIALENLGDAASWDVIGELLARYPADRVGLCYDSGHGNLLPDGLDRLETHASRLHAMHLHDNDGRSDQHLLPFRGTVAWTRLAAILARSSHAHALTLESNTRNAGADVSDPSWLADGLSAAETIAERML